MKIAVANSRRAKTWTNREITWEALIQRLATTYQTAESLTEFLSMPRDEQDSIKDIGGFVLGKLKDGRRKAGCVECRSAVALDMDYGTPGIMAFVKERVPYQGCAYGTHKYSPEKPRLRLIYPLSRDITEEEYEPVGRALAAKIGLDYFDDSTFEANRLMFWPSTPADVEYYFESWDGLLVDPDELLREYIDWRDISAWPTSSRETIRVRKEVKRQADPLAKTGIVGAFCRTYDIATAIERFLGDIYEESHIPGRYTYRRGEGTAGAIIYEGKFLYSHHATDPARGKLLNAFDLVRVHRFPDDDPKRSFHRMNDFALIQPEVKATMEQERQTEAKQDFTDELQALIAMQLSAADLYDDHNLDLAAYAYEHDPAAFESLRLKARSNGMKLTRYEQAVKDRIRAKQDLMVRLAETIHPSFVKESRGKRTILCPELADFVRDHLSYMLVQNNVLNTATKYVYEDGVYVPCSEDRFKGHVKSFITDYDSSLLRMKDVDEVVRNLNTDLTTVSASDLNTDENIVNFRNGILYLDTMELAPHSSSILSTVQIPCEWTGEPQPTPVFDAYLDTLLDGNEELKQLILQFIGAVISNVQGWRMKKALFLVGEGDTGKSQLKTLVERLIGEDNFSGIDLSVMEARFGTSVIYGKRLVGSSDMSFLTIKELKVFKCCTGGDHIFAEFKGQDGFSYRYRGLLWFCMNQLPRFGGDSGQWVYDRVLAVRCPNVIPVSMQNAKLPDQMYEERAGIVYKAVMALKDVIANGYRFSEPEVVRVNRIEYRHDNDSALEFMDQCMVRRITPPKRNDRVTVTAIYQTYRVWYQREYGNPYFKARKDFYAAIASAVGMAYGDMKMKTARGEVLRDFTLNPAYFTENDDILPYQVTIQDIVV